MQSTGHGPGAVLAADYDGKPDDMIELEGIAGEIDWSGEEGE